MSTTTIILTGNLGGDPKLFITSTGKTKAVFNLAVSVLSKDATGNTTKSTVWHYIALWGKKADRAIAELHKGTK